MITIKVPKTTEINTIRAYLRFLKPLSKLTDKEIEVLTLFLYKRYVLMKIEGMRDGDYLYAFLFSTKMRNEVRETLGLTHAHLGNIISSLKSKGALKEATNGYKIANILLISPDSFDGLIIKFK